MIGPLLGAAGGLAQAIMQANAINNQNNINWMALQETKRSNRKAEELQRATRRDAYGNEMEFVPGLGWIPRLTGITKNILDAEQRERRANLTEDAPRNRAAAQRMDQRSIAADEEFEKLFNEFRFREKPNKSQYTSDATQLLLNNRRKGLDEAASMLARQLIRGGSGSQIEKVFSEADQAYAGSLDDAMLRGKMLGEQNYNNAIESDLRQRGGEMDLVRAIADKTTTSPVNFSGFNQQMTGQMDDALQQLIGSIESGRGATQNAYGRLASGYGQTPDLGALISALSRLQMPESQEQVDPSQPYDPWAGLREVTI